MRCQKIKSYLRRTQQIPKITLAHVKHFFSGVFTLFTYHPLSPYSCYLCLPSLRLLYFRVCKVLLGNAISDFKPAFALAVSLSCRSRLHPLISAGTLKQQSIAADSFDDLIIRKTLHFFFPLNFEES